MPMKDFLIGNVTEILDGETFRIAVARVRGKNIHRYENEERIQIKRLRLHDVAWMTGVFTKPKLERMFKGKQVLCRVNSRDRRGRIEADVQLI